ncbi:LysR family transcriptional regulator [Serratia sp. JSRIV004]|uniref:helix-turn-helix domain-containing protein n=1 Tax=unclassified Serratia (in: enterobacteria) TaxID=2647522 RepID=UPI001CC006A4|nr:LysR family transcriptional regulator [Serratia sp. JSRIV004]UAN58516.1 LysR family transcriptional regulator [Serratia sp. JSRIV004]
MTKNKAIDISVMSTLTQINLKAIIVFVFVVETKSLLGASLVLGYSLPNISIHLKHLRDVIKTPLFTREGRCLLPTEYAIVLCEKFKHCLTGLYEVIKDETP